MRIQASKERGSYRALRRGGRRNNGQGQSAVPPSIILSLLSYADALWASKIIFEIEVRTDEKDT
jgi:hypothetical protein